MSVDSPDSLTALLRRARHSLWRWRGAQTLWYGVCASALALLCSGLIHILRMPVALNLWLSLLLIGPTVAGCYALLRQRPDDATAAAALDRRGDYQNFFRSAWEAHNMPAPRRPAGAVVLLQQAATLSPDVQTPADWSDAPRWYSRFVFLPWTILLSGLFLLQLPPAQVERSLSVPAMPPRTTVGDYYRGDQPWGDDEYSTKQGTALSAQAAPQRLESPRVQSGEAPPEQVVALGEELTATLMLEESPDNREPAAPALRSATTGFAEDSLAGSDGDAGTSGATETSSREAIPERDDSQSGQGVEFVDDQVRWSDKPHVVLAAPLPVDLVA